MHTDFQESNRLNEISSSLLPIFFSEYFNLHHQISILDCSIVFAIEAATLHPAKCLGIEKSKGTLDFGADADFVMLTDDLIVRSTWISGNRVYLKAP